MDDSPPGHPRESDPILAHRSLSVICDCLLFFLVSPPPFSDVGSSASHFRGTAPMYDPFDPYSTYRRSRRHRRHRTPSALSYYSDTPSYPYQYQYQHPYQYASSAYSYSPSAFSYAPSAYSYAPSAYSYAPSTAYGTYSNNQYGAGGGARERIYFSFDGKLIRSHKDRNYKRAQKLVLDLYPDMLQGIAASRIQFYVNQLVGVKSFLSENTWAAELDTMPENEIIGIEIRESLTLMENITSFFGGGGKS
ncbi:hypothetical protein F5148DRAFT_1184692 [Russula earlei]|uniref:Uncharacterized protein n=1 Tax=Russula earlei TaxID=71964 RepID=A0ACC0UDM2_9AGAM|nr:hypothetical protein F5148DRAFT_1184692 [Russula earlei]